MGLTNSQYQAIMRDYEQKQLRSHDRVAGRYAEVYEKLPEFRSVDDSISVLSVQYGKKLLQGEKHALESLKQELSLLREKKRGLLLSAGFPEDYLEPTFVCPVCQDTGYVNGKKCRCFKRAASRLLYEQSKLADILEVENFSTFSLDYYSEQYVDSKSGHSSLAVMKETLSICKQFARNFGNEYKNLFFYGDVGVGKTFLSNCIAKELMDAGFSVIYYSAPFFFNTLAQGTFQKDDADAQSLYESIFDCDLLIIDDLGTEFTNAFISSQFFTCLNERLLAKKSTIISTNLSLEALADLYTERSFSRITSNYTLLKLFGDDIRIKKKLMNREE